ncbi:MAG TPA: hypothetical protein VF941_17905, partial [Clostridia bacterium]
RLYQIEKAKDFGPVKNIYAYANTIRANWPKISDEDLPNIIKTGLDYLIAIETFIHVKYPNTTPEEFMNI